MKIVHTSINLLSTLKFIDPLAQTLIKKKHSSQIWTQVTSNQQNTYNKISTPIRDINPNLTSNIFLVIKSFFKILIYLHREKPDILEAHSSRGAFLPLLGAFLMKVPCRIYFNHGLPYYGYRGMLRWLFFSLERFNCFFSHHVITVNYALIDDLKSLSNHCSVSILGPGSACGIPETFFMPHPIKDITNKKESLNILKEDFVFLYVGRPVKRKGFHKTIDAFNLLNKKKDNLKLILAGISSEEYLSLKQEKNDNIIPLGYFEDMEILYEIADIVVLPSFHEGLPYCLLEAGAKRCSCIVSRLPGLKTIVINKSTGFLIDPHCPKELVEKMSFACANPDLVKQMGEKSQKIIEKYKQTLIKEQYLRFVKENYIA